MFNLQFETGGFDVQTTLAAGALGVTPAGAQYYYPYDTGCYDDWGNPILCYDYGLLWRPVLRLWRPFFGHRHFHHGFHHGFFVNRGFVNRGFVGHGFVGHPGFAGQPFMGHGFAGGFHGGMAGGGMHMGGFGGGHFQR
jgi:hypothetical protein